MQRVSVWWIPVEINSPSVLALSQFGCEKYDKFESSRLEY